MVGNSEVISTTPLVTCKVLVNALTFHLGAGTNMSGFAYRTCGIMD